MFFEFGGSMNLGQTLPGDFDEPLAKLLIAIEIGEDFLGHSIWTSEPGIRERRDGYRRDMTGE